MIEHSHMYQKYHLLCHQCGWKNNSEFVLPTEPILRFLYYITNCFYFWNYFLLYPLLHLKMVQLPSQSILAIRFLLLSSSDCILFCWLTQQLDRQSLPKLDLYIFCNCKQFWKCEVCILLQHLWQYLRNPVMEWNWLWHRSGLTPTNDICFLKIKLTELCYFQFYFTYLFHKHHLLCHQCGWKRYSEFLLPIFFTLYSVLSAYPTWDKVGKGWTRRLCYPIILGQNTGDWIDDR